MSNNLTISVTHRDKYSVIEIDLVGGMQLYRITATPKGMEITSLCDFGEMVVRPKTSNQVVIASVDTIQL